MKKILFSKVMIWAVVLLSTCSQPTKPDPDPQVYEVGDTGPSGVGIVFYITDGGLHGLEAAPVDQDGGNDAAWSDVTDAFANGSTALPTGIGTGSANTDAIIGQTSHNASAAKMCRDYRETEEGDWFLPSKDELNELYTQKNLVGGFANGDYWSSSENSDKIAWCQNFSSGDGSPYAYDKSIERRVRAVRAF